MRSRVSRLSVFHSYSYFIKWSFGATNGIEMIKMKVTEGTRAGVSGPHNAILIYRMKRHFNSTHFTHPPLHSPYNEQKKCSKPTSDNINQNFKIVICII